MKRLAASALALSALVAGALPAARAQDPDRSGSAGEAPSARLVFVRLNEQGAEEWYRPRDGAVVVRVPGGPYARRPYEGAGTTADPENVEVASFFIDEREVTNARFARFLDAVPDAARHLNPEVPGLVRGDDGRWRAAPGLEDLPVTAANGLGALAFAEWVGGELPGPDQWMKAAGGPEGRIYPWGDAPPDATRARFARPLADGPRPVGSCAAGASPYGCLDMAGNVYERVNVPGRRTADGRPVPAMLKGGSWVTPHPLNLRVLDLCMQPIEVADRSVGFRVVTADPEPDRPTRAPAPRPVLRIATDFDAAVAEARRRRVPVFLSLQLDTCGQCDRTRAQLFRDPRFVAYANENVVTIVGHEPGDAMDEPHPPGEDGSCPLYPGLTCAQHVAAYVRGLKVVGGFVVSPGNFVLHPDRIEPGAGKQAVLVGERELPKWGNAVDAYIQALEKARAALRD